MKSARPKSGDILSFEQAYFIWPGTVEEYTDIYPVSLIQKTNVIFIEFVQSKRPYAVKAMNVVWCGVMWHIDIHPEQSELMALLDD